jgi:hypothetical protein
MIAYSNVMGSDLRLFWLYIAVQWVVALAIVWVEGVRFTHTITPGDTTFPSHS